MFTPLDILYIVLAFCALFCTAFLCWLIYQVATVLRNVNTVVAETREALEKIERSLDAIKARFGAATSSMTTVVEGVAKVVDYAMERRKQHGMGEGRK